MTTTATPGRSCSRLHIPRHALEYEERAGQRCLCVHSTGAWLLQMVPQSPVGTVGYAALSFAIHPGSASARLETLMQFALHQC
jgi:hypothetical protein